MRRIRELEAWSTPGKLLSASYGKDLAQELWNLGVPREVYLGLNAIPDQTDIVNLRLAIEAGELAADDFKGFCSTHSLPPSLDSADSACGFLEYSLGRRLAWIHLPEDSEPQVLQNLIEMLRDRGHVVVDPDSLSVLARESGSGAEA